MMQMSNYAALWAYTLLEYINIEEDEQECMELLTYNYC